MSVYGCRVHLKGINKRTLNDYIENETSSNPDISASEANINAANLIVGELHDKEQQILAKAVEMFKQSDYYKAKLNAHNKSKAAEKEYPISETIDYAASEVFAERLLDGESFNTIIQARKALTSMPITAATENAKRADEAIEVAGVIAGRKIIEKGMSESDTFDALSKIAEQMPSLNVRSSTSMAEQAYSTPLVLAYVASIRAGITQSTAVLEPTTGNGALVMAADPANVTANDINKDRVNSLVEQGFDATNENAATYDFGDKDFDVVIANPPFGSVSDANGKPTNFRVNDQYVTTQIDHIIAINSLKAMSDDGKAVLIVGAPAQNLSEASRSDAYNSAAKRAFYKTLYDNYNVIDHFVVSGGLYAKQGAAWPVDVIIIDGVGKSSLRLPAADLPRIINTTAELKNELSNNRGSLQQGTGAIAEGNGEQSTGDNAASGVGTDTIGNDGTNKNGESTSVLLGSGEQSKESEPGSTTNADGRDNNGSGRPTRSNNGNDKISSDKEVEEDLGDMFDRILAEENAKDSKVKNELTKPRSERTISESSVSAAKNSAQGLSDAINGLGALFGGHGRLSSGLTFDEETYAKAKPYFISAIKHLGDAAGDITEAMRAIVRMVKDKFGVEAVQGMKDYVVRFISDIKSGVESLVDKVTPDAKKDAIKIENKFQAEYKPLSSVNSIGSLIPVNMQLSTDTALNNLKKEYGDIDAYVAGLLDYKKEDLGGYFSAEQVDAIGLALSNIISGKGFIIGDQTGIGKGRVNAAMIRYAILNKMTPIFVTEKPDLYGDMIRDLNDIGMKDIKPFATNSGFSIPIDAEAQQWYTENEKAKEDGEKSVKKYGKFITTPDNKKHNKAIREMASNMDIGDYDVIFTTYSQMQTTGGGRTDRMDFLRDISEGSLLILDESHNAGGVKAAKKGQTDEEAGGRAAVVRGLVASAKGVFYSSATYAKRPDVLDLYSKTDMGLVADQNSLIEALKAGGVPLQQAVASMLSKAGQYIRREKSFDGIVYDTKIAKVDRQFAENSSEIMRDIMTFDTLKLAGLKKLKDEVKADAMTITPDGGAGKANMESANFASTMHNMIGQMLLMLKVQPTIDEAIAALERGEKPVIALSNTMGAAIDDYVKESGLLPGDAINLHFGDLLKRYLKKSRTVTETDAFGNKEKRELTDDELGPAAAKFYRKIGSKIDGMSFSDYAVSPIDAIHNALHKAGYKTGEITGRKSMIDYSGNSVKIEASKPTTFKVSDNLSDIDLYSDYAKAKVDKERSNGYWEIGSILGIGEKYGHQVVVVGKKKTIGYGDNAYSAVPVMSKEDGEVWIIGTASLIQTGKSETITKDYQTELDNYNEGSDNTGLQVYKKRPGEATTPAGKRKTISDFNNGLIDAVILNQSGATGVSLHASPKVGGDIRKRHMIIAQAELNIDTHMQMLGRINRTGQVVLPSYVQLVADIPAEKRPAAILAKKMAMLNAQTTAGKDSAVKAKDVPDFMNDYGDEIAAQIMTENREIHKLLGSPLAESLTNGYEVDEAMRKVTGRIPVLKLEQQEQLYAMIEEAYNEYIDMLNKTGQNGLEAGAMALDAKTIKSEQVVPPTSDSKSPFAEGVNAETVDVKRLGKPFTIEQIQGLMAKNGITDADSRAKFSQDLKDRLKSELDRKVAIIDRMASDTADEVTKQQLARDVVNRQYGEVTSILNTLRIGQGVTLTSPQGVEYLGYFGNFENKTDNKNMFAPSGWKATIYVADVAKQFVMPLSKLSISNTPMEGIWTLGGASESDVTEAFNDGHSTSRENRVILTGNMLAAYGFNKTGRIINYTNDSNETKGGVLMPKKFDLVKAVEGKPIVFTSPDLALEYIQQSNAASQGLRSSDNNVRLMPQWGTYKLYVPAKKATGSILYNNKRLIDLVGDFYKSGKEMQVSISNDQLEEVLRIIYPITKALNPISKENGKAFLDSKGIKYSKSQEKPTNTHSETTLLSAIRSVMDKSFGNGWTDRLMATGKVKTISSEDAANIIGKDSMFHKVWHGSPHDHNKFDTSYINSGEGAQVFGYGLYFSGSRRIAEWYRSSLSGAPTAKIGLFGSKKIITADNFLYPELIQLFHNTQDLSSLLEKANERINTLKEDIKLDVEYRKKYNERARKESEYPESRLIDQLNTDIKFINKIQESGGLVKSGKLYEVELAPTQDEYLDWDKPLSEQSELVKSSLEKKISLPSLNEDFRTAGEFYKERTRKFNSDEKASKWLHSLGIRGIRYKAEGGKSNETNYVVFSDEDVKIEVKYSKDGNAQAFYDIANDITYLIADNISKNDDVKQLLLHEIGEHALQLGKNDAEYQDILNQIELLKETDKDVQDAFKRVPPDTADENWLSEVAAYLVQHHPDLSISQRIMAWFRAALRKIGKDLGIKDKVFWNKWANTLTPKDLVFMATEALRTAPESLNNSSLDRKDNGVELSDVENKIIAYKQFIKCLAA